MPRRSRRRRTLSEASTNTYSVDVNYGGNGSIILACASNVFVSLSQIELVSGHDHPAFCRHLAACHTASSPRMTLTPMRVGRRLRKNGRVSAAPHVAAAQAAAVSVC